MRNPLNLCLITDIASLRRMQDAVYNAKYLGWTVCELQSMERKGVTFETCRAALLGIARQLFPERRFEVTGKKYEDGALVYDVVCHAYEAQESRSCL